jgi:rubrerythrin
MSISRRKFLALAGTSALATPVLAACAGDESGDGDAELQALAGLLTLEYVEADFYAALVDSDLFPPKAAQALGRFGKEEERHAATLIKTIGRLGGEPEPRPKTRFSLDDATDTLEVASELENLGAAAYLAELSNVSSKPALETVLSIHSVEGRHAAAINTLLGKPASPDGAFAKPIAVSKAVAAIAPYLADRA